MNVKTAELERANRTRVTHGLAKTKATEPESAKRTRVTLDLSERSYRRLNELTDLVDAESKAALMRQALQCFEYIAKQSVKGTQFRAIHPDGREENVMFFLPAVEEDGPEQQQQESDEALALVR